MTTNNYILSGFALVLILIFTVLAFASCSSDEIYLTPESTTQNIVNNTVTISADNTNDLTYASALGLRSAVSIYCTFETTASGGSFWNPTP